MSRVTQQDLKFKRLIPLSSLKVEILKSHPATTCTMQNDQSPDYWEILLALREPRRV